MPPRRPRRTARPVLAEIGAHGTVAGPDNSLQSQPANAIARALAKAGRTVADLDLIEINEAFAAVAIQSMRDLGVGPERVNVNGGAIALGHPIGASGARIALHLVLELRRRGGGLGAAALCGGGGQGDALLLRGASDRAVAEPPPGAAARRSGGAGRPRARDGDARALARLVSLVENRSPELRGGDEGDRAADRAMRGCIGLTGSPGVGKSTVTGSPGGGLPGCRAAGRRAGGRPDVARSPAARCSVTGCGCRIMRPTAGSSSGRWPAAGTWAGCPLATPQALRVLDAAGFDLVLVETVGVGQAEVEIASLAESTLVIVAPGMGDSIQAAKAGILEIADIFVVNKADRPAAQEAVRDLRTMLAMGHWGNGQWKPPIVSTVASAGTGIEDLTAKIGAHWAWLDSSAELSARRRARAREEIAAIAVAVLRERLGGLPGDARLDELAAQVAAGQIDPYSAADELVSG